MTENSKIHIGTSGWHYGHWEGSFYPSELSKEDYLDYYCKRFQTVEVNNSFYQLPDEHTLEEWRDTAPGDFTFAVKANRYITHMKKLKDPKEPVSTFLEKAEVNQIIKTCYRMKIYIEICIPFVYPYP